MVAERYDLSVSRLAWGIAALLAVVVAGAAVAGLWDWSVVKVLAVIAGWLAVAVIVRHDAARVGADAERWARIVIFFGWFGLAYWLLRRRGLTARA